MSRFIQRSLCQLLPALLAIWCSGCGGGGSGGGATVNGTVTLDGAGIENGTISFQPESGEGAPAGGKIINGQYSVKGVTTGKNRIHVDVQGAKKSAREAKGERGKETVKEISLAGAQGNDQSVDVQPGTQTKDVQLQKGPGS
jgi:hypothetical protein